MGQKSKKVMFCACGASLPDQKTGRPRRRCDKCEALHRRIQLHERYLKKLKFPGVDDAKLEELQKLAQHKKDVKTLRKEFRWLAAHLNARELQPELLLGHAIDAAYINKVLKGGEEANGTRN